MILLDTSVLSRVLRRSRPSVQERRFQTAMENLIADDEALGLPGIVLQEVLSGIKSEKQFAELERHLAASFTIVNATPTDHVDAARLKNRLLSKGLNVAGIDCLIATVAMNGSHRLLAADADFALIARHSDLELFELP